MLRPAITQLISKNDSYYSLVIGIAKRAREISDELLAEKMTLEEKPVKTAVEEFANGKFRIVETKKKEEDAEGAEAENASAEEDAAEGSDASESEAVNESEAVAESEAADSANTSAPPIF